MTTRRQVCLAALPLGSALQATPLALQQAIDRHLAGAPLREGRVTIDIPPLVENGNAVPVTLAVPDTPAAAVQSIALFTEHNPAPEVMVFSFGPQMVRAAVATRIRLARSQQVVALARLADGSAWARRAEVVVTLAACIEGI